MCKCSYVVQKNVNDLTPKAQLPVGLDPAVVRMLVLVG